MHMLACRTHHMHHAHAPLRPTHAHPTWVHPWPTQPAFFEPLRRTFKLHFAEDFGPQLKDITNNYALYAVETLLFFGSQASVESLSFQSGWFVDACFPGASLRGGRGRAGAGGVRTWTSIGVNTTRMAAAHARHPGAVDIQCRDASGVLINGVLYGPACGANYPCGRRMYLAPQPTPCGQPRLAERLMLTNRSFVAKAKGVGSSERLRCAARDGRGEARGDGRGGEARSEARVPREGRPSAAERHERREERREGRVPGLSKGLVGQALGPRGASKSARAHLDAAITKVQGFLRGAAASAASAAEAKGGLKAAKKRAAAGASKAKGAGGGGGKLKGGKALGKAKGAGASRAPESDQARLAAGKPYDPARAAQLLQEPE